MSERKRGLEQVTEEGQGQKPDSRRAYGAPQASLTNSNGAG